MATMNPFDLLVDDDNEDPNQLASTHLTTQAPSKKTPAPVQQAKPAKLPTKPLPPAQAVREVKNESSRGRGGGRGFGRGRGGSGGFNRDAVNNENDSFGGRNGYSERNMPSEEGEKDSERRGYGGPRGSFRGRRRGGFSNGDEEEGERPRRTYERRSGTGRGNEIKRDGAGRRNWGTPADEIAPDVEEPVVENEKNITVEQQPGEDGVVDDKKEDTVKDAEEKEPEDKEMTLKEYEKIREEKRKQLLALKTEVRKAEVDDELEGMQQLSSKKNNDEIFAKLGAEKDKRKDYTDKDEKAKKSVTINEFLKPAEGERYFNPGGRGRGRGRGPRGAFNGSYNGSNRSSVAAPSIEDPGQFPSLSAK